MAANDIPRAVSTVVGQVLGEHYFHHATLESLFMQAGAPGEVPEGSQGGRQGRQLGCAGRLGEPEREPRRYGGSLASRTIDRAARRSGPKSAAGSRPAAIPAAQQTALQRRLEKHLHSTWSDAGVDIVVRFRGRFAYIGYVERVQKPGRRDVPRAEPPMPLFRLAFTGDARRWVFALFTYSHEDYEPCLGPSGSFTATPEQAFDCAARLYLS